jgi:phenylalanine-4-hydroxylase
VAVFESHKVNLTNIETRLKAFTHEGPSFIIDFEGKLRDQRVEAALGELRSLAVSVKPRAPISVPWFPQHASELDAARQTLDGGTDLINEEHPGFHDKEYVMRRKELARVAQEYKHGEPLPLIEYTAEENATWEKVYKRLKPCYEAWACDEFLEELRRFEDAGIFSPDRLPQLADINHALYNTTGWRLRPIDGLLTARDFLNALAFRVFNSTQYIRHHGNPFYTPEPDVVHEFMGHVPLLANPAFAEFAHRIGLASLGAPDSVIDQLATLYWFTIEFGVISLPDGRTKAYGAGLLSSFGEMEWSCASQPSKECRDAGSITANFPGLLRPEVVPLDCKAAATTNFPITTYQPKYFGAPSLDGAKHLVDDFCESLPRVFYPQYDMATGWVRVTRAVELLDRSTTADMQAAKQKDYFAQLEESNRMKSAEEAQKKQMESREVYG